MEYFFKSFLSLIKVLLLSKYFGGVKLKPGKESCIILANGPSLNQSIEKNLILIQSSILYVVNYFAFSDYFDLLKPKNYILAAPEFFKTDVIEEIINSNKKLFYILTNNVNWELNLFVPFLAKRDINLLKLKRNNKSIRIHYFNITPVEGYNWFCNFMIRSGLGMPRPHNVLIPTLIVALNQGNKKILVFGADHSWLPEVNVTAKNRVLLSQKHFYDEKEAEARPMNKGGKGERKLYEILQKWVYAFFGYFVIRNYSDKIGAQIINKTPNSYIDAFERE